MSKNKTKNLTVIGLFTAITSILCAIPIGINILGVPCTLQTFAICLLGFLLGEKMGVTSVFMYILLGFIGMPVFNGFMGGPSVLFGINGGFIFGFIPLSYLCALSKRVSIPKGIRIFLPFFGLLLCHLLGTLQFCFLTGSSLNTALLLVCVPYFPKDLLLVAASYFVSKKMSKGLRTFLCSSSGSPS